MKLLLFIPIILSFLLTLYSIPKWIKKCKQTGFLWEDMNKSNRPKDIASSGGFVVITAFTLGVLAYIAIRTFFMNSTDGINLQIVSSLVVVLILTMVGMTDDFLGWKHKGLSRKFRLFIAFFASIPLVVINAGSSIIDVPLLGSVNFGLFYPLLIVPLGIAGATTTYNFLAGFNGLEAGQGIIILTFLSIVSYLTGSSWLSIIGLTMVAALGVFYYYNKYPAKVFPGDSLTWCVGALIAIMAILGNMEKIAVFIFIPYIIDTFLTSRGKLVKAAFGKPNEDGSLEMPYPKIYHFTHLSIFILKKFKKKVYEKDVVYFIFAIQIIFCILAAVLFL